MRLWETGFFPCILTVFCTLYDNLADLQGCGPLWPSGANLSWTCNNRTGSRHLYFPGDKREIPVSTYEVSDYTHVVHILPFDEIEHGPFHGKNIKKVSPSIPQSYGKQWN